MLSDRRLLWNISIHIKIASKCHFDKVAKPESFDGAPAVHAERILW